MQTDLFIERPLASDEQASWDPWVQHMFANRHFARPARCSTTTPCCRSRQGCMAVILRYGRTLPAATVRTVLVSILFVTAIALMLYRLCGRTSHCYFRPSPRYYYNSFQSKENQYTLASSIARYSTSKTDMRICSNGRKTLQTIDSSRYMR